MKFIGGLVTKFLFGTALVITYIQANYDYGKEWQQDYPVESQAYQTAHGVTPTEYQVFLDSAITGLGTTITESYDWEHPTWVLSLLLDTEAIKHKAAMDQTSQDLTYSGSPPTQEQKWLYEQLGELDFAVASACSMFNWTYNPNDPEAQQIQHFASLLSASLDDWIAQYQPVGASGFDRFMQDKALEFVEGWKLVTDKFRFER